MVPVSDVTASGLKCALVECLHDTLGLSAAQLASKLVAFGADGASVMQGHLNGLAVQVQADCAPFAVGIRCPGHSAALAAKTASKTPLFAKMQACLAASCNFFSHSCKRVGELAKSQEEMQTKGLKLLQMKDIRWMSVQPALEVQLSEYSALLHYFDMKPDGDALLDQLTDMDTLLAHHAFAPMLNELQYLSKGLQQRDLFYGDVPALVEKVSK